MKVTGLLVRADVQSADDNLFPGHSLHYPLVEHKLLIFGGVVLGIQIDKLAAEQADTLSVILQYQPNIPCVANIGVDLDFLAIQRHIGFLFQPLQKGLLFQIALVLFLHSGEQLLCGFNVNTVVVAIQNRQFAIPAIIEVHTNQGGNVHSAGQDCRVAVAGAVAGNKAQQFALIKLDGFAGGKIVSHQNSGLIILNASIALTSKDIDHPPGNVFDIRCPGLHIGIFHSGKCGGKVLAGSFGGIFGSDTLRVDHALDGIQIVLVLQHHLVNLEDGGVVLAHFLQSFLIQPRQLLLGFGTSGFKPLPLLVGRDAGGLVGLHIFFFVNAQRADGNAVQNGFSGCYLHQTHSSLQIVLEELLHRGGVGILAAALHSDRDSIPLLDAQTHDGHELGRNGGFAAHLLDGDRAVQGLGRFDQQTGGTGVDAYGVGDGVLKLFHGDASFLIVNILFQPPANRREAMMRTIVLAPGGKIRRAWEIYRLSWKNRAIAAAAASSSPPSTVTEMVSPCLMSRPISFIS